MERDRPDRVRALVLEHGIEGDAVVAGLVDAAGGGGDVVLDRVGFGDGQVDDAAAHDGGADVAGAEAVKLGGGDLGLGGDGEEGDGGCCGCGLEDVLKVLRGGSVSSVCLARGNWHGSWAP